MIDRLHYITQENERYGHLDAVQKALVAGCRWIQLRVKDRTEDEVLSLAHEAVELCRKAGARIIINDYPAVAIATGADGLHLGLLDLPVKEARKLTGPDMIIGGTANTAEDVLRRVDEGADYVGLGPFRFTRTKKNLSPILGLDGYYRIMNELRRQSISLPVIAIGGILPGDIEALMATGIHGVAVSGAITDAVDARETLRRMEESIGGLSGFRYPTSDVQSQI